MSEVFTFLGFLFLIGLETIGVALILLLLIVLISHIVSLS